MIPESRCVRLEMSSVGDVGPDLRGYPRGSGFVSVIRTFEFV
jgi:hypothetical protein